MKPRIVTDALDPLTRPVLDYLVSEYGIDPHHIKRIQLDSTVNDIQMITVTLIVQAAPSPLRNVPLLRPPMRDERPAEQAHQPKTTCVYMVEFPGGKRPCGELIRKDYALIDVGDGNKVPGMWDWIHVSDGRLGTSAHPATPGY